MGISSRLDVSLSQIGGLSKSADCTALIARAAMFCIHLSLCCQTHIPVFAVVTEHNGKSKVNCFP
jgi:hypothetical protein